jgi:alkylation response protein AidB-like acyl-CoA dehydrogenase
MFFLNEDHQLFKKAVDEFVEKEALREKVRLWHRDGAFPYQIYHKMADLGWLGIAVPPAYGGMGLDALFVALLNEGLARYTFELSFKSRQDLNRPLNRPLLLSSENVTLIVQ